MARVWKTPPLTKLPTAQALAGAVAATPTSSLPTGLGLGLGTRTHLVPFQCRISVRSVVPAAERLPTAHALVVEVALTPRNTLGFPAPPGLGLATRAHDLPFQCKITVRALLPLEPTAQAFLVEVAATELRMSLPSGLGLRTVAHFVPFQRRISVRSVAPLLEKPTAQTLLREVAATPVSGS